MSNSQAIFWNIWGHRRAFELHNFLEEQANTTDVICLTEVTDISNREQDKLTTNLCHSDREDENATQVDGYRQLYNHFRKDFHLLYNTATRAKWTCQNHQTVFKGVGFGSVIMLKSDLLLYDWGSETITLSGKLSYSRVLQWVCYKKGNTRYLLAHLHGIWVKGNTKGDCEERRQQSLLVKRKLSYLISLYGVDKVIFGGDLNLDINTKALSLLEGKQYRNLVKEFGITNTRTPSYRKFGLSDHSMYADYVLVSKKVEVSSFTVHNHISASDHAPLIVSFS